MLIFLHNKGNIYYITVQIKIKIIEEEDQND